MKSSKPRNATDRKLVPEPAEAAPKRRPRMYPVEVNTPEAHIEFLECIADILNQRIDEVKRDLAKNKGATSRRGPST
jgi:hypothetical protein